MKELIDRLKFFLKEVSSYKSKTSSFHYWTRLPTVLFRFLSAKIK